MKLSSSVPITLAALAIALAGCGKANQLVTPGSSAVLGGSNEQAEVSSALASVPELADDALLESSDPMLITADGPAGAAKLLHPLRFWRRITSISRTFEFAFSDTDSTGRPTQALVTVRKRMLGIFNILNDASPEDGLPPDSASLEVIRKPLADLGLRRLLFRRIRVVDGGRTVWKLVAASGAKITSFHPGAPSPELAFGDTRIVSLRFQSASRDTEITDPLALIRLRRIPAFQGGEDVTLTATTLRNDDVVVLIRDGERRRFHNNGDNTYTLLWHTPPRAGLHHVGVNALSHGTLFDDQAPYDSQAWVLPYVVLPTEMADYLP